MVVSLVPESLVECLPQSLIFFIACCISGNFILCQLFSVTVTPYRSESDASGWSKIKLKELLVGLEFKGTEGSCKTVEVVSCNGEASAK